MSSSDEGEIVEDHVENLKATALPRSDGSGVDRQDRPRSRYSSPDYDSTSRYSNSSRRSRSPRGFKRSRDDRDRYSKRDDRDSRRIRTRYNEPSGTDYRHSRTHYNDIDRQRSLQYDDDRRPRNRDQGRDRDRYREEDDSRRGEYHRRRASPSPQRNSRNDRESSSAGRPDRPSGPRKTARYDDGHGRGGLDTRKTPVGENSRSSREDAKSQKSTVANGMHQQPQNHASKAEQPQDDFEEPQEIDEDAEIERRRKRREELLAKSSSATPLLLHAVGAATDKTRAASPMSTQPGTPQTRADPDTPQTPHSNLASPRSPGSHDEPSPGRMELVDADNLMNQHSKTMKADEEDGPSAADYDPTADMQEDERRDELRNGQFVIHGEAKVVETIETPDNSHDQIRDEEQKKPASNEDDEDFDMFADDFDEEKYATKPTESSAAGEANGDMVNTKGGILEGDDKDGYYKIRVGEILDGRYQLQSTLGRGMFSGVVRAVDVTTKKLVAIKIMRNNDALRKGGYTEIAILQKLNDADPDNKKHIVMFERSFDYRGHLCMAFENLSMNLREVLRKFGNNVGINLGATRAYAYQIFVSLAHMRKCSIIHADLKPDNILVNENRTALKICDLGTAIDRSDAATAHTEITPYLVSRFYRAPEIILGIPYDYGVDMWSIGCTLYELYTGKILFTGDSNNQMLKSIMEIRGRFTPKLFKRGQLAGAHFNDLGQFVSVERDKVLGKTAVRTMSMVKPTRDLRTRLMAASTGMNDAESRDLNHFVDLLEQCLALNPDKRIKPVNALRHPFFTAKMGLSHR